MIYFQLSRTFCFVLHPQRHVYVQWRQRCFSPFLFEKKRLRQEFLGLAQGTSRNQTGGVDHNKDGDVDHVSLAVAPGGPLPILHPARRRAAPPGRACTRQAFSRETMLTSVITLLCWPCVKSPKPWSSAGRGNAASTQVT